MLPKLIKEQHCNIVLKESNKSNDDFSLVAFEFMKMNGIYWGATALDILGVLEKFSIKPEEMIDYIFSSYDESFHGFSGAPNTDFHILYTCSAIQALALFSVKSPILHNKLRSDEKFIKRIVDSLNTVASLQREDGSFAGDKYGEIDNRFVFCALLIITIAARVFLLPVTQIGMKEEKSEEKSLEIERELEQKKDKISNDDDNYVKDIVNELYEVYNIRKIDVDAVERFILSCFNDDGGCGVMPNDESHAGQMYCCIGTLSILHKLSKLPKKNVRKTLLWMASRQDMTGGFNGRPLKQPDVCYSWWLGAPLYMLGGKNFVNRKALFNFILSCQDINGGISDRPENQPDVYHTFFGVGGLSLYNFNEYADEDEKLKQINPAYALPQYLCEAFYLKSETLPDII